MTNVSMDTIHHPEALDPQQQAAACLDADGAPLWEQIDFDVPCSRCGYDLRMLPQARCPECGLAFAWRDMLVARFRRNLWTFEANWRQRPLQSWLATLWRGLRPRQFWADISIHEPVRPGPLWLYLALTPLAFLLVLHPLLAMVALLFELPRLGLPWLADPIVSAEVADVCWEAAVAPVPVLSGAAGEYWRVVTPFAMLFLAMLATVAGLRQTLGRCRVRTALVLRAVAYATAPAVVVLAAYVAVSIVVLQYLGSVGLMPRSGLHPAVPLVFFLLVPAAIPTLYLRASLRLHLRLPHTWFISIAAVVIGILTAITCSMFANQAV
jgi:hypothetical protein